MVLRICGFCGGEFFAKPSAIKRGYAKYCSRRCLGRSPKKHSPRTAERKASQAAKMRDVWASGRFDAIHGRAPKIDWSLIQRVHDEELISSREVVQRFGISRWRLARAIFAGHFVPRKQQVAAALAAKDRDARKTWTPEERDKQSQRKIALYKAHPEKHPNRRLAGNRTKMSFPEQRVFDWLMSRGIEFEHNAHVGKYWIDFLIGDIALEVDGARWHDPAKDAVRDVALRGKGLTVIRLPAALVNKRWPAAIEEVFIGA